MQRRIVAVTLERASRVPTLARSALERVAVVRDADARILHAGAASAWHSRLGEEEQLVLKKRRSVGKRLTKVRDLAGVVKTFAASGLVRRMDLGAMAV